MFMVHCIDKTGYVEIDSYSDLEPAIGDLRGMWNEGDGPQTFIIQDVGSGEIVATLMRGKDDPEVCITTYNDGRMEKHVCTYILDDEDRYVRTDVAELLEVRI